MGGLMRAAARVRVLSHRARDAAVISALIAAAGGNARRCQDVLDIKVVAYRAMISTSKQKRGVGR